MPIERPPAELDRLAVGEKFAAMRFDLEPAELDARRMRCEHERL
jgi:hypothetical protein